MEWTREKMPIPKKSVKGKRKKIMPSESGKENKHSWNNLQIIIMTDTQSFFSVFHPWSV